MPRRWTREEHPNAMLRFKTHTMALLAIAVFCFLGFNPTQAIAEPIKVLFVNGTSSSGPSRNAFRKEMSDWLNTVENGRVFESSFFRYSRTGGLARALEENANTQVLVLDLSHRISQVDRSDAAALQAFYSSGKNALILDGSFGIRSLRMGGRPEVLFPGIEGSSGGLLANQIVALAGMGGGILIGTDHFDFQVPANAALRALLPDAQFTGTTNPSTDGAFIGDVLLNTHTPVKPAVLLRHWETVPNQGEAPIGSYTDFTGAPVRLYTLVEAADKPGGGRKRPYISASFDPGNRRFDLDSEFAPARSPQPEPDAPPELPENMPTRKSATR